MVSQTGQGQRGRDKNGSFFFSLRAQGVWIASAYRQPLRCYWWLYFALRGLLVLTLQHSHTCNPHTHTHAHAPLAPCPRISWWLFSFSLSAALVQTRFSVSWIYVRDCYVKRRYAIRSHVHWPSVACSRVRMNGASLGDVTRLVGLRI